MPGGLLPTPARRGEGPAPLCLCHVHPVCRWPGSEGAQTCPPPQPARTAQREGTGSGTPPLEAGNGQAFPVGFYPFDMAEGWVCRGSRQLLGQEAGLLVRSCGRSPPVSPAGECADRWGTASGLLVWRQNRPKRPVRPRTDAQGQTHSKNTLGPKAEC